MNILKVGRITCSMDPLRPLMPPPLLFLSPAYSLPWIGVKSVKRSGNRLQLHHRMVHYTQHRQLYRLSFKHCQLKQLSSKQQQQQGKQPLVPSVIQQVTNLHTNGNNLLRRPSASNIILGDRIKEALVNGSPIVALESTVITHGLPEPDNLSVALSLEERIANCVIKREETRGANINSKKSNFQSNWQPSEVTTNSENEFTNKVTPATVGIVNGQIIVGLSNDEIEYLATKSRSKPIKASRRDISIATALGLSAGTTVSATMAIASSVIRPKTNKLSGNMNAVNHHSLSPHLSAIKVFATGGIGGVHKGGENSLDISADLFEFANSPIGVVSSGFKSFLDTKRSLEYLETMGCTVISLNQNFNSNSNHYSDKNDSSSSSNSSSAWLGERDGRRPIGLDERQRFLDRGRDCYEDVVGEGSKWLNNDHHESISCKQVTLEQLHRQQNWQEEEGLFPGFYSQINSQRVKSPCVVNSIEEAGKILYHCLQAPLLDRRGFLLALAIPKMFSLDATQMKTLLAKISNEIDMRSDIEGKEKTPMVLERFSRETGGASLRANVELLKNNAQVGALLALEYSKIENKTGAIIPPFEQAQDTIEFVTNSLVTENDNVSDSASTGATVKTETKVREAISERDEKSGFSGADACLNECQSFGRYSLWQILDSKRRVYEKLSDIGRNGGAISNEDVKFAKDDEDKNKVGGADIGMQLDRRGIFGTNSGKQTRQVDEAKQVLCEEEKKDSKFGRGIKRQPVVVGCTMIDMHCRTKIDDQFKNNPRHSGVTFTGEPHLTLGGVGRNLATALNFLGHKPTFITALADDTLASLARSQLSEAGFSDNQVKVVNYSNKSNGLEDKHRIEENWIDSTPSQALESGATKCRASSCFAFVLIDSIDGQCEYVIADLECVKAIDKEAIKTNLETIKQASLLVIDANLSSETIEYLIEICHKFQVPIFIEPTDILALPNLVTCMGSVLHSDNPDKMKSIVCLSPNVIELKGMIELFEAQERQGEIETRSLVQQQQQQLVQNEYKNFTGTNNELAHSISSEQKEETSIDHYHEKSTDEQMTLEQIEHMATRLMQTHLPQIKCLLVTMDKRGVLVALRSRSSVSVEDKKATHKEQAKYNSDSNIELVKLMDEIGNPLSEKIHIKHFKPLKTIKRPISASGAGDSFAAGFISGLLNDQNLEECLERGFKASQLALQDKDTISSQITVIKIYKMDGDSTQTSALSISESVTKIPRIVCKEDVTQMINLQMSAIDRLEATNKSLHSCNMLARDKYTTTMKLFKRTAKQMNESKKDLDIIYKKIIELKNKIRIEKPELFENKSTHGREDENDDKSKHTEVSRQPEHERIGSTNTRPLQRSSEIAIAKSEK